MKGYIAMTQEYYDKLNNAGALLCNYCENTDDCENCQVSRLLDDAYVERTNTIVDGDDDKDENNDNKEGKAE